MAKTNVYTKADFLAGGLSFGMTKVFESKTASVPHSHDFIEICYVYKGTGYHCVDDIMYQTHEGDIYIINYDMTHYFKSSTDDVITTFNIMFDPCFFDEKFTELKDFQQLTLSGLFGNLRGIFPVKETLRLKKSDKLHFDILVENMFREFSEKQLGFENMLRTYLSQFIVLFMRTFEHYNGAEPGGGGAENGTVELILSYLKKNYNLPLDLDKLSRETFFSKSYLCKIFKNHSGMTMSEYINNLRIESAYEMIKNGSEKIMNIAAKVGFSDYKSFYLAFKKRKGVSPNKVRETAEKT